MNHTTHEHLSELLPAYALDALDDAETRTIAAHLRDCADCNAELAELREAAGALAFGVPPAMPPPRVKAALFERIERLAAPGAAAPATTDGAADLPADRPAAGSAPPREPANARQRFRGMRVGLAALAAVLILGLLGWGLLAQSRLNAEREQLAAERQRNDRLATRTNQLAFVDTLLNDPNAAFPVIGPAAADYGLPAAGYIYVDPASTVSLMLTYWLPQIGADQRFQVWLVTPDGQRDSGGLFTADARGNAHVLINAPAPFAKYKSVGVTIEPAAGSAGPTSPRVCGGDIR